MCGWLSDILSPGQRENQWKHKVNRYQAEKDREWEEEKRRAAEYRQRRYNKRLRKHQEQFTCAVCGKPSPGPGKKVIKHESIEGTWEEVTDELVWDKPHPTWVRCVVCYNWVCSDCGYERRCKTCIERYPAEQIFNSTLPDGTKTVLGKAVEARRENKREKQKLRLREAREHRQAEISELIGLWRRLDINFLIEAIAEAMWSDEPGLEITEPWEGYVPESHEGHFPLRMREIKGPLGRLFLIREGFCNPRREEELGGYLRFWLSPEELRIEEPYNTPPKWYFRDRRTYETFIKWGRDHLRGEGWKKFSCTFPIYRAMHPKQILSLVSGALVEDWYWRHGSQEVSLGKKAWNVREYQEH